LALVLGKEVDGGGARAHSSTGPEPDVLGLSGVGVGCGYMDGLGLEY
jgi:hypothetical protein